MSRRYICPGCENEISKGKMICDICGSRIDWDFSENDIIKPKRNILGIIIIAIALMSAAAVGAFILYDKLPSESQNDMIAQVTTEAITELTTEEITTELTTEALTTEVTTEKATTEEVEEEDYRIGAYKKNKKYSLYRFYLNDDSYKMIIPKSAKEIDRSEDGSYAKFKGKKGCIFTVEYCDNDNDYTPKKIVNKDKKAVKKSGKKADYYSNKGKDWAVSSYVFKKSKKSKKYIYYSVYSFSKNKGYYCKVTLKYPKKLKKTYEKTVTNMSKYVTGGKAIKKED